MKAVKVSTQLDVEKAIAGGFDLVLVEEEDVEFDSISDEAISSSFWCHVFVPSQEAVQTISSKLGWSIVKPLKETTCFYVALDANSVLEKLSLLFGVPGWVTIQQ